MDAVPTSTYHIDMAADIVSAFVSHNSVRAADLPELIASVHSALARLGTGTTEQSKEELHPPVPIKKSITPDFLISLKEGRRYKSLRRHLSSRGLTPEQYRERWGLARDYPMVAPNYAKQRSELAKALGLGQLRRNRAAGSGPAAQAETTPEPTKKTRGRRKRTAEAA